MDPSEARRAAGAGRSTASALGLQVDDAVVIHNTGRIALRLVPCDVLARVQPASMPESWAQFEVEVARRLGETDSPVGALEPRVEPRVYVRDDFAVTLWTYYEPVPPSDIAPADYAHALIRLHAGYRQIDLEAPDLTGRIARCAEEVGDRELSPELADADREFLGDTLSDLRATFSSGDTSEHLLHGEPHPGNLLSTRIGPLFVDLGGCCRGPVEFDLVHAPEQVAEHYPGINQDLIHQCRILMWVFLTNCRWGRDDQLPNRDYWRVEGLNQLRAALEGRGNNLADVYEVDHGIDDQ